jgi:Right handed beta helix region
MRFFNSLRLIAVVIVTMLLPAAALTATASAKTPKTKVAKTSKKRKAVKRAHSAGVTLHLSAGGGSTAPAPATIQIPAATGRTYYVSLTGNDSNSGTSVAQAWKTVAQVDRAQLNPGDQVLFQGGQTFNDDALMPGWGTSASGTSTAPINFSTYGPGQATLPQGVWFKSDNNLAFQNLLIGNPTGDTGNGFQGNGNGIILDHDTIQHVDLGIDAEGNNWTIANSTIADTGNSGMLLGYSAAESGDPAGGNNFLVTGNLITHTGLNPADTFGTHGIYDKVTAATITNNTITDFNNDGVSVRYRNSTISGNHISGGNIGLAWFQYDTTAGTSKWTNNTITNVTTAGMFICGPHETCPQTLENFQITRNIITNDGGTSLNLQPTTGTYNITQNSIPTNQQNTIPTTNARRNTTHHA